MATNGHYYSYIFDRVRQVWYKLNDHISSIVPEDKVMREALGGYKLKCACNLFYINQHIEEEIQRI